MLNEILRKLREENNYSQVEVAKKLDIGKDLYNKYERTEVRPPYEILIKLSEIYGVSLDYILTGKEYREKPSSLKENQDILKQEIDSMTKDERAETIKKIKSLKPENFKLIKEIADNIEKK